MENAETIEIFKELTKSIHLLSTQMAGISKDFQNLKKSSSELGSVQKQVAISLKSTAGISPAKPLTSIHPAHTEEKIQDAFMRSIKNVAAVNGMGTETDAMAQNTQKALDILQGKKTGSGDKSAVSEHSDKLDALLKGQEVIATQFNDNPYLRKISEIEESLGGKKSLVGSVGNKIAGVENWSKGYNPLNTLVGGIGKSISSTKGAFDAVGTLGSRLGLWGIESDKVKLEKTRRAAGREGKLVNAYASKEAELKRLIASKDTPSSMKSTYESELKTVSEQKKKHEQNLEKNTSDMSVLTSKILDHLVKKSNKEEYKHYTSDEKKLLSEQMRGNINESMMRSMRDYVGKKSPTKLIGTDESVKSQSLTFGQTLTPKSSIGVGSTGIGTQQQYTSMSKSDMRSTLGKLQGIPKNIQSTETKNGIEQLMKSLYTDKAESRKQRMDQVLTPKSAIGFGNERLKRSSRPSTINEGLASIVDNMSVMGEMKTIMKNGFGKLSDSIKGLNLSGGMGMTGTMMTLAGGALMAMLGQSALGGIGIGDGAAGGSVVDDTLLKGGRGLAGVGVSKGLKSLAKPTMEAGAKGALKGIGKGVGKSVLKKVPVLGAGAGIVFGAQRAMDGDILGATGEIASGIASLVPGIGTAISIGIDGLLAGRDIVKAQQEDAKKQQEANKKRVDDMYNEKYGFKGQSGKSHIELTSSQLKRNYTPEQQMEMAAKLNAYYAMESQFSGKGRTLNKMNAVENAAMTGQEMTK